MSAVSIGLDLAKSVFQVHGVDAAGRAVLRCRLARASLSGDPTAVRLLWGKIRHSWLHRCAAEQPIPPEQSPDVMLQSGHCAEHAAQISDLGDAAEFFGRKLRKRRERRDHRAIDPDIDPTPIAQWCDQRP